MKAPAGWLVGWQSVVLPEGHASRYPSPHFGTTSLPCRCSFFCGIAGCGGSRSGHSSCGTSRSWTFGWFPRMPTARGGWLSGNAHTSFGILAFAVGSVLSAQAAFQIIYEGAQPQRIPDTSDCRARWRLQVLFLGPLLVFSPTMGRVRRAALDVLRFAGGPLRPRLSGEMDR